MKTKLSKQRYVPPKSKSYTKVDSPLLMLIFLLLGTGLLALFTASFAEAYYNPNVSSPLYYVLRQGLFALLGLCGMFVASNFDYHKLHFINIPLASVATILLVLTPIIGTERNDAIRWIYIGPISVQPSEIAKLAVIISFASFATIYNKRIKTFTYGLLPYAIALGVIAFLLKLQPHLSATIIIAATGMTILFVAGIRVWYFIPLGAIGAAGVYFYLHANSYAMRRVEVWLDPFIDFTGNGWQAAQSFIAIGSGGFWGLGLGKSVQKYLYLPEAQNDFIFSVICEELGFVGALMIIIMFAALITRGFYIAARAKDKFGALLAVGIVSKIAIQTIINMFVVTGIFPVTGASLPFFSSGGTSLIIQLVEVGILLNISRQLPAKRVG